MFGQFLFTAELTLIPTEDGGRRTGIKPGYRPEWFLDACPLGGTDGAVTTLPGDWLLPGESAVVDIHLVRITQQSVLSEYVTEGREISAMEGPRLVARGRILEVVEKMLDE